MVLGGGARQVSSENPGGLLLDGAALAEFVMRLGFKKTHMNFAKVFILGWLAGCFVSFGSQTFLAALAGVDINGPTKLLAGSFFATGLMVLVICGGELFNGNVLIWAAVLSRRVYVWEFFLDLLFVFCANFLGVISMAVMFWGCGVNGFDGSLNATGQVACTIAVNKSNLPNYQAVLRGIGANMCVTFAVLLAFASKTPSGKILASIFPIAAFACVGFEHAVANQFFYSLATLLNCNGLSQRHAWGELFLCSCGNIIGTVLLASAYWYVNIHGTKLALSEVPHHESDNDSVLPRSQLNGLSFAGRMSEDAVPMHGIAGVYPPRLRCGGGVVPAGFPASCREPIESAPDVEFGSAGLARGSGPCCCCCCYSHGRHRSTTEAHFGASSFSHQSPPAPIAPAGALSTVSSHHEILV
mmetsp:Transcript_76132/g.88510  ORF Transcript_76132/g.88510 Transcript_76132/m.88510 type:complete len:413 (+) Transcript_76132:346-1584(+)